MSLDDRSLARLEGVHHDLAAVVLEVAKRRGPGTLMVIEGLRTLERQKELLAAKATQTLKSRHLRTTSGVCHAVDLGVMVAGELRWDWPLYTLLAKDMKQVALELAVPLEWGGDWKSFKDGPHYQLPWKEYP